MLSALNQSPKIVLLISQKNSIPIIPVKWSGTGNLILTAPILWAAFFVWLGRKRAFMHFFT
ncbi:hypothetical protein CANARDRAFT_30198, partial [[Candida] arabinofermentans NRRL YB-2248]